MIAVQLTFYVAAGVAVVSTLKTISEINAVRALLYLILSLLASSIVFYILGAPFAAALEVITYAGAIMVLFVFVTMMLNLGPVTAKQEKDWLNPRIWIGPSFLSAALLTELIVALTVKNHHPAGAFVPVSPVTPRQVGAALFGPYAVATELASMLLLAGLVGAYHLGFRSVSLREREPGAIPRIASVKKGAILP